MRTPFIQKASVLNTIIPENNHACIHKLNLLPCHSKQKINYHYNILDIYKNHTAQEKIVIQYIITEGL